MVKHCNKVQSLALNGQGPGYLLVETSTGIISTIKFSQN